MAMRAFIEPGRKFPRRGWSHIENPRGWTAVPAATAASVAGWQHALGFSKNHGLVAGIALVAANLILHHISLRLGLGLDLDQQILELLTRRPRARARRARDPDGVSHFLRKYLSPFFRRCHNHFPREHCGSPTVVRHATTILAGATESGKNFRSGAVDVVGRAQDTSLVV